MKKILFLVLLSLSTIILSAQPSSADVVIKSLEKSIDSLSKKLDKCCIKCGTRRGPKPEKHTSIWYNNPQTFIDINNKINFTLRKIDSSNTVINSRIDSCCAKKENQSDDISQCSCGIIRDCDYPVNPSPKIIKNPYCIFLVGCFLLVVILLILLWCRIFYDRFIFSRLLKSGIKKALPHLPFVFISWTIGICLFLNVYGSIDFSNPASIGYQYQLLLLFSICLLLLPFLKSIKIGSLIELQKDIRETKQKVNEAKEEVTQTKGEVRETKEDVKKTKEQVEVFRFHLDQISNRLENAIHNANSQKQAVNQYTHIAPSNSDDKFRRMEDKLNQISRHIEKRWSDQNSFMDVPDDTVYLFRVRYKLEQELKRIWEYELLNRNDFDGIPVLEILNELTNTSKIDNSFINILIEVFAICDFAIQGKKVTDKQTAFVRKKADQILDYLVDIKA